MGKAILETPDYVVFNGSVGSTTGDKALTAEVGDRVRLFVGNGGPNLVSSFHVIGEIFDLVNTEGGSVQNTNVQTTLVPAGGSAIVEFTVDYPGTYILVDHSIFRAFNKGALAMMTVTGEADSAIYSGLQAESVYLPEGGGLQGLNGNAPSAFTAKTMEERMVDGGRIYAANCAACHQAEGQGIPGVFPPVAGSDYLMSNPARAAGVVINGLSGPIEVNGVAYNGVMPAAKLTDEQVANVVTYVMNSFGNKGTEMTPSQVANVRAGH